MSLAELLSSGCKKATNKEPEISHLTRPAAEASKSAISTTKFNREETELLNRQVLAQSREQSREQERREQEAQVAQKRALEQAAEQAAALAKRRRETGVALTLECWQNSEEVWYKSAKPNVYYDSVYVSDVPIDYSEEKIKELHRTLGLNPDLIVGIKFLPLTRNSLGSSGVLRTGSILLRYGSHDAAQAVVERMKGHPIRLGGGELKYLGARHAAAASWMIDRSQGNGKPVQPQTPMQAHEQAAQSSQQNQSHGHHVRFAGYGDIDDQDI